MKRKQIGIQVIMACLSNSKKSNRSIHDELEETIAERKRIMKQFSAA